MPPENWCGYSSRPFRRRAQMDGRAADRPPCAAAAQAQCRDEAQKARRPGGDAQRRVQRAQRILRNKGDAIAADRRAVPLRESEERIGLSSRMPPPAIARLRAAEARGSRARSWSCRCPIRRSARRSRPGHDLETDAIDHAAPGRAGRQTRSRGRSICERGQAVGAITARGSRSVARCGSSRSRSPSPRRLKPSTHRNSAMPGTMPSQGACAMKPRPVLIMLPQDGSGGCAPRPRKAERRFEQDRIGEGDRRLDQRAARGCWARSRER